MENEGLTPLDQELFEIEEAYDNWLPLQAEADKGAYVILGRIYALGCSIDVDPGSARRKELEFHVRCHSDVKATRKWTAGGKRSTELIVTTFMGLKEKRARKSNWIAVLEHAADCGVEPTAEAFVEWITTGIKGGIEGALDQYRGVTEDADSQSLEAIAKAIKSPANAETLPLKISDFGAKISILAVRWKDEENVTLLHKESDATKVRKALIDIGLAKPTRKKKPTPVGLRKLESKSLIALTRIAVGLAHNGKFRRNEAMRFTRAVNSLNAPELTETYFKGGGGFDGNMGMHAGEGELIEQNPDFDILDPGRYVRGAIQGRLIPYTFVPGDKRANLRAAQEYIDEHKYVTPKPAEPRAGPRPTLDAFIDQPDE